MLIMTRGRGQSILVGENVEITVLGIHRGMVRIGVKAPPEISVDRTEVRARKLQHPERDPRRE